MRLHINLSSRLKDTKAFVSALVLALCFLGILSYRGAGPSMKPSSKIETSVLASNAGRIDRISDEYDDINEYFASFNKSKTTNSYGEGAAVTTSEGTYFSAILPMDNVVRRSSTSDLASYALIDPPFESNHGSNLLLLPSGDLLLVYFSGDDEGGDGVAIALSKLKLSSSSSGPSKWTRSKVISQEQGRSAQNPVLYFDAARKEVVLLHTSQKAFEGQATSEVRRLVSKDEGETWSQPETLFSDHGAFLRNQVISSLDGKEFLLPMYYTPMGFFHHESQYSSIKRSKDGLTWEETVMTGTKGKVALVQPTLVRLADQSLQAFFRSREADYIYFSTSKNDGKTWTDPVPTKLVNNNSGIQALRLLSGSILIVFNNVQGRYSRFPLSVALSIDNSKSFHWVRDVEPMSDSSLSAAELDDFEDEGEYSYPSVQQSSDGTIHISYTFRRETIKYVQITEEWIQQQSSSSRGTFQGE